MFRWQRVTDEQLLDMRLCDLPVRIEGSPLEARVERLYEELEHRGIRLKPRVWLSEEWFSPDGVPGIAIPFYLAHARLMSIERRQMLEVEGGTEGECMRILRHEAGHAVDTAFRLHFKRSWRQVFGRYTRPYPEFYKPKLNSRNYVLHLDAWYAQAHPAEDFAETFAVWLTPESRWRRRYRGWPAIQKLEYVDALMKSIAGKSPRVRARQFVEPLTRMRQTLRDHYRVKREKYSLEWPAFYDRDLRRIFSADPRHASRPTAASFLRSVRRDLSRMVSDGTGVHPYTIYHVLEDMTERCKQMKLRMASSKRRTWEQVMIMVTAQTMNVVHSGHYHIAI